MHQTVHNVSALTKFGPRNKKGANEIEGLTKTLKIRLQKNKENSKQTKTSMTKFVKGACILKI